MTVWGDLTVRCHPRSAVSNVVYFTERFDPAEMAVIEAVVNNGDLVVDAGANIGLYTLLLARLVGSTGSVVAFEPIDLAASRLEENIELNGLVQVRVERTALGAAAGTGTMSVGADVSNTLTVRPGRSAVTDVLISPLDDIVPGAPSFVKIDVEGYEHETLKGATRILASRPILQIEITNHLLQRTGSSSQLLRDFLCREGYRFGFPTLVGSAVQLDENAEGDGNLIAVPAERWDEVCVTLDR